MDLLREPGGPEPARPSRVGLAVVAVLVVASAIAWWAWRRPPAPPAPATAPVRKAERAAKARPVPTAEPSPTAGEARGRARSAAPATAAATPEPRLRVDADVPGASVFLDRKYLGTTPVETTDFTPGSHRLNVSAEGVEGYAETIDIPPAGRDLTVRLLEVRLDEALDVVHKHGVGSCRGRLTATTAGLVYEGGSGDDSLRAPLASLEPLQVDYLKKNLRLKVKGGKTWNFTADSADALLVFQKAVEAARKRL